MRKAISTLAVTALSGGLAATLWATAPAAATGGTCQTVKHGDTAGITLTGGATATLVGDGVKLTTPVDTDQAKVSWKYTLGTPVDADALDRASYTLTKLDQAGPDVNNAALPSYHIYVKAAAGDGVLIYEPYWQPGVGNPTRNVEKSWNVLAGNAVFWTSSTTIDGLPKTAGGPPTKTWNQVKADNPDLLVTGFGWALGTYNRGVVALLNDVKLGSKSYGANTLRKGGQGSAGFCQVHEWSGRYTKPSASASSSASASASATATGSTSTSPVGTTTAGSLPVTGPGAGTAAAVGAAVIVAGVIAVLVGRRRRVARFVAE